MPTLVRESIHALVFEMYLERHVIYLLKQVEYFVVYDRTKLIQILSHLQSLIPIIQEGGFMHLMDSIQQVSSLVYTQVSDE